MAKFRKKPVIVEAEQFFMRGNPEHYPEGIRWDHDEGSYYVTTIHGQKAYLTDEDFVITEPDGLHHYPCKPAIFAANYEPVFVPLPS
jgi:hypothetical protein